jgi:ATP phosphoribosyltransferase regulatory subunit HisZ
MCIWIWIFQPEEYYSGMIFKVYAQGAKEELISGGRYDKLASKFGLRKYACGFGHNLNLSSMLVPKSRMTVLIRYLPAARKKA